MITTEPNHIADSAPLQRAAALRLLLADRLAGDLASFAKKAWKVLNPTRSLIWSWHYDYLCEMLTLVKQRRLRRLIINIPPRTLKSTLVTVIYPSWVWLSEPEHNFLTASYSLDLSTEHSVTRRSLLSEPMVPAAFRRPLPVCRRPQSSGAIRQRPARPDDCDLGRRDHGGPGMRHRHPR